MAEPWDTLRSLFPDNTEGNIGADDMRAQVDALEIVDSENVKGSSEQVILKNPGDADDIADTIAGIIDATSSKRYVITLNSGMYITKPVLMKEWIFVQGEPGVTIAPDAVTDTIFTMATDSSLTGVTLNGATSGTGIAFSSTGGCAVSEINIVDCNVGINAASTGYFEAHGTKFAGTMSIGVLATAGEIIMHHPEVFGPANIQNFLVFSNTILSTVSNALSTSPGVVNGIVCADSAAVLLNNPAVLGADVGITVTGGSNVTVKGGEFFLCRIGASLPPDVGQTIMEFSGSTSTGSTELDFSILNENAIITGIGIADLSKSAFVEDSEAIGLMVDLTEGDRGIQVFGELKVGTPLKPSESAFGEGDSYASVVGTPYWFWDGSAWSDVTAGLASPSASLVPWPNLLADTALYMTSAVPVGGDTPKIPGFKALLTQEVTSATEYPFVVEYWNGATWVNVLFMASNSSGNYQSYAKGMLANVGSEQVRFDAYLVDAPWVKNDPMSLGTPYYWIRIRAAAALTQAPILEQLKVHSNRTEINGDGFMEFFGKARPFDSLGWDSGLLTATGNNPVGEPTYVSDNLGRLLVGNLFRNGDTDSAGFNTYLPNDVDTSVALRVRFAVFGTANSATNAQFVVRWGHTSDGDAVYDSTGAAPTVGPNEQSEVINLVMPPLDDTQTSFVATLDISEMVPAREVGAGDILWVSVARPTGDAYGGDIVLINLGAEYVKYTLGGHI